MISALSMKVGGGEVLAMSLAAELSREHNVYLFNQHEHLVDTDLVKKILPANVKVLSMGNFPLINFLSWKINAICKKFFPNYSFYEVVKSKLLRYYIWRYNIQVVSSHSKYSDWCCTMALKKRSIPLVLTEHGEYVSRIQSNDWSFVPTLDMADAIVTVSNYNKLLLSQHKISCLITTIYNGINLQKKVYHPSARVGLNIPTGAFVYGMVGRGIKEKGWQQAIDAFLQVATQTSHEVFLILVGGSAYLNELKERYRNEPRIIFTGESAEPGFYIEAFDVGLLPTTFKAESLPLVLIECLFLGKPVIASNIGGIPEIVRHNGIEMGQLIHVDQNGTINIKDLVKNMLIYLENKELYIQHVQSSHIAEDRFSIKRCTEEYYNLFTRLCDKEVAGQNKVHYECH